MRRWTARLGRSWGAAALGVILSAGSAAAACDGAPWDGRAMEGSLARIDAAAGPVAAWYEDPTERYPHGVLGDTVEAGTLAVQILAGTGCETARITLPETEVFEDLAPRLADLDGDGRAEIVAVQSHRDLGARLAVYGPAPEGQGLALLAATPNIGTPNRWLAPAAAADLDGDGHVEIAYVDRPHLARVLRVWRYLPGGGPGPARLEDVAALPGLSNHRIGEAFITGGLRDCGGGPEVVTADAGWTRVMATVLLESGDLVGRDIAPFSPEAMAEALACED